MPDKTLSSKISFYSWDQMSSYRLAFLFKYCKKQKLLLSDTNSVHFIELTTVRKYEKIFNQKRNISYVT